MPSPLPEKISRYRILQRLGEGGMGSLYLARDPAIDRLIAIKLLRADVESDELRERFAREARAVGRLRHQNIVVVFDVGEDDNRPFIAMEYVEGETLSAIIRERRNVPIDKKLQWIEQLCDGLAYAHRAGLVHRDIKPANLMVDSDGLLKILDFGVARISQSAATGMTQAGTLMGTLNYMSPEQMSGLPIDHRSDIFSVGAVAYELLAYQRAFGGDITDGVLHRILHEPPPALQKAVPGIDPALVQVVDTALAKNRELRYQDLDDMRADVTRVRELLKLGPVAAPPPVPQRVPNPETLTPVSSKVSAPVKPAPTRDASARLRYLVDSARRALEDGLYDEVVAATTQALTLDPGNVDARRLKDEAQGALDDSSAEQARQSDRFVPPPRSMRGDLTVVTPPPKDANASRADASSDATAFVPISSTPRVERTPPPKPAPPPSRTAVDDATRYIAKPAVAEIPRSAPPLPLPKPLPQPTAKPAPAPRPRVKVPPMAIGGIVAVVVALGALGLWRAKPRPVVPGTLILNPTPWANVETIVNAQASGPDYARACPTTPCVLPLPPGQYNIRLSGPGFQTVTVAVTVSAGGSRQITQHMTGFDADQAIKDILEKQP